MQTPNWDNLVLLMISTSENSIVAPHMLKEMGTATLGMNACWGGGKGGETGSEMRNKGKQGRHASIVRVYACGEKWCCSGSRGTQNLRLKAR